MIKLACSATPWFWTPIGVAVALCVIGCIVALRGSPGERLLPMRRFEGPGLTNSGAISTALTVLPLALSSEVRADVVSSSLLSAATLLLAVATAIGIWLYSTVAAQKVVGDKQIEVDGPGLIIMQGIVITFMVVAAFTLVAFTLFTPLISAARDQALKVPPGVIVTCDAKACTVQPKT